MGLLLPSVPQHNVLPGKQGGTVSEYFHLTSAEHTELTAWLDDVTLGSSGALTLPTGQNFAIGTTTWNSADEIDGTKVKDADYGDVDVSAGGAWTVSSVQNDSVELGTDTTGNYVASIIDGLAIDGGDGGSEGATLTIAFDPTELLGSRTWGDGSTDTIVWTWDRQTGTDPNMIFGNDLVTFNGNLTAANLTTAGTLTHTAWTWLGATTANWTDNEKIISIADSATPALRIQADGQNFISITPAGGGKGISFGNTTDNIPYAFIGTGLTTLGGKLIVAGGEIGPTGDQNLLQLAANALTVNGSVTATTTVQGEQITSTDDITMAGLFTNTMAADDTQGLKVDGVTNDFTLTSASLNINDLSRDIVGSGTLKTDWPDDFTGLKNTLNWKYVHGGDGVLSDEVNSRDVVSTHNVIEITGSLFCSKNKPGAIPLRFTGVLNEVMISNIIKTQDIGGEAAFTQDQRIDYFGSRNILSGAVIPTQESAGGTLTLNFIGGQFETALTTGGTGHISNYYGGRFIGVGRAAGTSTSYGGWFSGTGSDTNFGIWIDAGTEFGIWDDTGSNWVLAGDNQKLIFGSATAPTASTDMLISSDGTNGIIQVATALKIGDGGAANYTNFADDGFQTMAGTARVLISIDLEPVLATRPLANPPGEGTEDNFPTHDFNPSTEESVYFHLELSHDYADAGTVHVHFDFFVDTAPGAGDPNWVMWGVEYKKQSIGDNFSFTGTTTTYTQTSVTAGTPANDKKTHQSSEIDLTTTGFVAGDYILLRLFRDADGTGGTDNFTDDARVIDYHIEYLSDKIGEPT